MFTFCSGRWPGHGARDLDGIVFLDLDPMLFETVLNWLRLFNISRTGNLPEPVIPEDKVAHMLVSLAAVDPAVPPDRPQSCGGGQQLR